MESHSMAAVVQLYHQTSLLCSHKDKNKISRQSLKLVNQHCRNTMWAMEPTLSWRRAMVWHCFPLQSSYSMSATVCEPDQSKHLCPALGLLTKSKTAAITGTQWGRKKIIARSFQQFLRRQNFLRYASTVFVMFPPLTKDLSDQVLYSIYILPIPPSLYH